MQVIRSFFIAVSIYSRIPVPQFAWKEEDMKYTFCFFPWIGAWIGCCIYFWNHLCDKYQIGAVCRIAVSCAVPILITGGFHIDGFMDTMDAVHSYGPREKKLEIFLARCKDCIIISDEIGNGIVPADPFERAYRERMGRILIQLASQAEEVERVICGIGQKIK